MIAKETVLNKMLQALQSAKENIDDEKAMIEHVKVVHTLSELMLESPPSLARNLPSAVSSKEAQVMGISQEPKQTTTSKDDDGTSIFDF